MRKAFNHYYNIHEIKKQLNDEQYLLFDKALCGVQFLEIHIESVSFKDHLLNLLWTSIKHTVKSNIEGYCSKMKIDYESLFHGVNNTPYIDPCQGGTEGGSQQEKEKEKEKEEGKGQNVKHKLFSKNPNANGNSYFSLNKPCCFEDIELVEGYKERLKETINKHIDDLIVKRMVANSPLEDTYSFEEFENHFLSNGMKKKDWWRTYLQYEGYVFENEKKRKRLY